MQRGLAVDAERASLQAQLDELERQAQQAAQAATTFACPFCGARMGVSDLFCSGCGKPIAEIKDAFAAQQQAEAYHHKEARGPNETQEYPW